MLTETTLDDSQTSRTFAHPPLVHSLAVFAVAFFFTGILSVLALPLVRPGEGSRLLIVACLASFLASLQASVLFLRRSREVIVVADDGLSCRSPAGEAVSIPWAEIASVKAQNVMQRLLVQDAQGTRRIHLEYHLQDYGELRRIVLERSGESARSTALELNRNDKRTKEMRR